MSLSVRMQETAFLMVKVELAMLGAACPLLAWTAVGKRSRNLP